MDFQSNAVTFGHFQSLSVNLTHSQTQEFVDNQKVGENNVHRAPSAERQKVSRNTPGTLSGHFWETPQDTP